MVKIINKKILLFLVILVFSFVDLTISASAVEIEDIASDDAIVADSSNDEYNNLSPRASTEPTQLWNWTNGDYGVNHNEEDGGMFYPLWGGSSTKTYYKFDTGTGKLTIDFSLGAAYNYENDRRFVVKLYKAKKGFWENLFGTNWEYAEKREYDFVPDEHNIYKQFSGSFTFRGLSNDYDYYFEFYNNSPGWETSSNREYYAFSGDFSITNR